MKTTKKQNKFELIQFVPEKLIGMKMKSIMMIAFTLFGFSSFSQVDEGMDSTRQEKVQQLKIAYITRELSLTSSEAEKFWPVYNEMDSKLKSNRKEKKKKIQELKNNSETLKDDEVKKRLNAIFDIESQELTIKKEYIDKIALVIGYKKSAKLLNLEQEFRRELLKRLNQQKKSGNGQKQGGGQRPMKNNR